MNKQIYLNDEPADFTLSDLPMLIHGADGNGASLFSITMAANYFRQGIKILFMSGFHMARDEFREQTKVEDSILLEDAASLAGSLERSVVFVPKESPELFLEMMNHTAEPKGWVFFLKNIELLDAAILERTLTMKNVILSGDVDRCTTDLRSFVDAASTKIVFTSSVKILRLSTSKLPKYTGLVVESAKIGHVTVR